MTLTERAQTHTQFTHTQPAGERLMFALRLEGRGRIGRVARRPDHAAVRAACGVVIIVIVVVVVTCVDVGTAVIVAVVAGGVVGIVVRIVVGGRGFGVGVMHCALMFGLK